MKIPLNQLQRTALLTLAEAREPVDGTEAGIAPMTLAFLRRRGLAQRVSFNRHEITKDGVQIIRERMWSPTPPREGE